MVLYHGADPWNAPVTVEDLVPGLTGYVLVRPESVDPETACPEDIPALVLGSTGPRADGSGTEAQARRTQARAAARHRPSSPRTDRPAAEARVSFRVRPLPAEGDKSNGHHARSLH